MLFRQALGAVLRERRLAQNSSLRELATCAGVSLGYLSEVERGRKEISSELLAAVASALTCEVGDVIGAAAVHMSRTGDPSAPSVHTGMHTGLPILQTRPGVPAPRRMSAA